MINYSVELLASNDHEKLEEHINAWLGYEKPERIVSVGFVADGAEFTYCALILYLKKKETSSD